eukprot:TRINITY_DN3026_c0_g2_i7.p1 TRINITY_DN3026_c0_g2~~TRINITY_DN3026_c0_g2_i7.p1  ORF type:complete len:134 (-),score=16.23 TRINITY_DN3026_c0_g2_i7:97-498(-)
MLFLLELLLVVTSQDYSTKNLIVLGFFDEVTALNMTYQLHYNTGGQFNGKGKYLCSVAVIPTRIDVHMFYTFNMSSRVTVGNIGTEDAPVAGMKLFLEWVLTSTIGKVRQGAEVWLLQGDGTVECLSPEKVYI